MNDPRTTPKLTILIVSYNAGDKLLRTLESITSQSLQPGILIKDGGSADGSFEAARKHLASHGYDLQSETEASAAVTEEAAGTQPPAWCIRVKDNGIYDAMNQAITALASRQTTPVPPNSHYILFLNCGDYFADEQVAADLIRTITGDRQLWQLQGPGPGDTALADWSGDGPPPTIYYGDVYERVTGQRVASNPRLDAYGLYRNVPCHQACIYDLSLLIGNHFNTRFRVRADYEQFLRLVCRAHARTVYTGRLIADYEGGGFSETPEHLQLSEKEHRAIIRHYLSASQIRRFDLYRCLTLAPLRTKLSRSPLTSGLYNHLKQAVYQIRRARHVFSLFLIVLALSGCAQSSSDRLPEVVAAVHSLHETRRATEVIALSEEAEALSVAVEWEETLLALNLREAILAERDYAAMKEERIAAALLEVEALRQEYDALKLTMNAALQREREEAEERQRHTRIPFHLQNATGHVITGVFLAEGTASPQTAGSGLLPEGTQLAAGETILGLVAEVDLHQTDRQLVITDDRNQIYQYALPVALTAETAQHPLRIKLHPVSEGMTVYTE